MRLFHWSAMKFPDTLLSGYADLSLIWKPAASWAHANAVVLCSLPENWSWCIVCLTEIYGLLLCPQLRLTDAALKTFCIADTSLISMNIVLKPCSYGAGHMLSLQSWARCAAGLRKLWCMHGWILLFNLQILWWWGWQSSLCKILLLMANTSVQSTNSFMLRSTSSLCKTLFLIYIIMANTSVLSANSLMVRLTSSLCKTLLLICSHGKVFLWEVPTIKWCLFTKSLLLWLLCLWHDILLLRLMRTGKPCLQNFVL